jgi:hypothetical protein
MVHSTEQNFTFNLRSPEASLALTARQRGKAMTRDRLLVRIIGFMSKKLIIFTACIILNLR